MPKTKTKTKYLNTHPECLSRLCFLLAFREVMKKVPANHHLSNARPE